jgi:hypothetical protein
MADDTAADPTAPLLSRRSFLAAGAAATAGVILASGSHARSAPADAARAPRPLDAPARPRLAPEQLDAIVEVRIHPGLGIGRVGSAKDAFFLGPEVVGATAPSIADLRDAKGALARQAQRYRIYGYDANGDVVGEVTAADATIDWSVHLANRKAAWYRFGRAMDIPEAATATRRNAGVTKRRSLVLDAGRKHANPGGSVALKATARSRTLLLGELLTDDSGRLIVLPGRGRSTSWNGKPVTTFANNDAWFDDIADGPVDAVVTLGTRTLPATGAWFASAPPNYAPAMATGWRTILDLVEDTWVAAGWMKAGDTVSFQRHIRPLFTRLAALQWVNAGILRDHGWRSGEDLASPALLAKLADPSVANRPFRKAWAKRFRDLESGATEPKALPPILGDAAGIWSSPRAWTGATGLQLYRLDEWAAGRFEADSTDAPAVAEKLADLPLPQRPRNLDRAALDGCLAEAFDPGCELPWILRRKRFWSAPFRVKRRNGPEPDFGPSLTPSEALGAAGPLNGSVPGAITRWMGIPWQTDTINCRTGYRPSIDTLLDTFWAGRVPNHVLTQADYAIVMDTGRPLKQRRAAFRRRKAWWRGMLTSSYIGSLNRMVNRWDELGFVMERPGPGDGPFPATFGVEMGRRLAEPSATAALPPNVLPRELEDGS